MKNHWVKIYERKQNRWWTAEFSRNGIFLLKPRRVQLSNATKKLMCSDDDTLNTVSIILKTPNNQKAKELVSFLRISQQGMTNMYARLRMFDGIYPVCAEVKNYELTDLIYVNLGGGWGTSDVQLEFTCNHIREYVISP